jgi:multidrug efflux pump subunit AcrA (membrane-fusion protein)
MSVVSGRVSQINLVRRISPEGTTLFEVVLSLENPGTLTAGMDASAVIRSGAESIYPSETGQLAYGRTEELLIRAPGRLTYVNLVNYMDYNRGETLCRIEYREDNSQVETLRQTIRTHEQDIEDAESEIALKMRGYDNLNVRAPMSGTVMYNNLIPGEIVEPGLAVISVAKLDKMMVEAQIDERQVGQVRPGMPVQITVWMMDGQQIMTGVVRSVNMTPADSTNFGGSVVYYPAVFEIENYSGMLMSGQGVDYRLVVDQRFDILVAPVIAVKNTEQGPCVFVRSDERPGNAIDLAEGIVPPGFFAVPVECGIGNENGIEIISGIEEGSEVFTQIIPLDEQDQGGMRGGVVYYG